MVEKMHTPLPLGASSTAKEQHYQQVSTDIKLVLQGMPCPDTTHPPVILMIWTPQQPLPASIMQLSLDASLAQLAGQFVVLPKLLALSFSDCTLQYTPFVCAAAEADWVAAMATVSSMLHNAFEYYHWTVRQL